MAVTYRDNLPCIEGAGEVRKLAALVPDPALLAQAALFSSFAAPDPSTWKDCDFSHYGSWMKNQGQYGSCTGYAGVTALDIVRRMSGQAPVKLSCTFPYAHVNGGRDQGASVSSILKVLREVGTCTEQEAGVSQIYKHQIPQRAWETAQNYRVLEAFLCRRFEELCEAINRGFPVALGIRIGQNFNRLDRDGVAPIPDTVVGGHAMCGVGLKRSRQGDWLIKIQNSWGQRWGQNGFAYLTKGHFDYLTDGYAVMYAKNIDGPPPVPQAENLVEKATGAILTLTPKPSEENVKTPKEALQAEGTVPPEPAQELQEDVPSVQEPEMKAPAEVTPVAPEQSLLAQFEEPVQEEIATPSDTHVDPEALTEEPKKKRSRHKHGKEDHGEAAEETQTDDAASADHEGEEAGV